MEVNYEVPSQKGQPAYRNHLLNAKNAYDLAEAHAQSKPSASSSSASNAVRAPKMKKGGRIIAPSTKRRKKKKSYCN